MTGKYLGNVGYPYAKSVSMLVLRGRGGARDRDSTCWGGQAGPGNAPWRKGSCGGQVQEVEELHAFLGENKGLSIQGGMRWREKNICFPNA